MGYIAQQFKGETLDLTAYNMLSMMEEFHWGKYSENSLGMVVILQLTCSSILQLKYYS